MKETERERLWRLVNTRQRLSEKELADLARHKGAVTTKRNTVGGIRICGVLLETANPAFALFLFKDGAWHRIRHYPSDPAVVRYHFEIYPGGCYLDSHNRVLVEGLPPGARVPMHRMRLFELREPEVRKAFAAAG